MDGQPVFLDPRLVLDRPVVDVLSGVVADRARYARLHADAQVAFVSAENHPVEIVHRFAVQSAGVDDALHCGHHRRQRAKSDVPQRDKRPDRLQLDSKPG